MALHRTLNVVGLLLVLGVGCLNAAEPARIYRYVDDQGRTTFDSNIPAQFVKNGYTILDGQGRVLEVIPRALTATERTALAAQQEKIHLEEMAKQAQVDADNLLIRLYRTPADIELKRDEDLKLLDSQIDALKVEAEKVDEELVRLQALAADSKNKGAQVSPTTEDKITKQTLEKDRLATSGIKLANNRAKVATEYDLNINRLRELQGITENSAAQ